MLLENTVNLPWDGVKLIRSPLKFLADTLVARFSIERVLQAGNMLRLPVGVTSGDSDTVPNDIYFPE